MKTISFGLSEKEIDRAIKELKKYENELKRKIRLFVDELARVGVQVVGATMSSVPEDDQPSDWKVDFQRKGTEICSATIRLTGTQVLFIEFGTGWKYRNPKHPKEAEFGYTAGSYGKGRGLNPKGWWYKDETVKLKRHTYGNRPYMPMYLGAIEMRRNIQRIAREVFNG